MIKNKNYHIDTLPSVCFNQGEKKIVKTKNDTEMWNVRLSKASNETKSYSEENYRNYKKRISM